MTINAIIYALFGNNSERIRLLEEAIVRMTLQCGKKQIYLIHNILPGDASPIRESILEQVIYIRAAGNPVVWQKEAMYNLGAKIAIENGANNLIFIDGDIIPGDNSWLKQIENRLKENDWVHGGRKVFYLNQESTTQILQSPQKELVNQNYAKDPQYYELVSHSRVYIWAKSTKKSGRVGFPGGAWGATRSAWSNYKGWDLHNVVGGGDLLHFNRLIHRYEEEHHHTYGNLRALLLNHVLEDYINKEIPWKVSYIDKPLYHLWHGGIGSRKYETRYTVLLHPEYQKLVGTGKSLRFDKKQVLDIENLIFTNDDLLLDLNENYHGYRIFFEQMADYFISRQDSDVATINRYLDYRSADFRLFVSPMSDALVYTKI
jgi:hypothetical protein